ncbi:MAG: stage III sporulation protein AA [Firmicutes bacterium]|nr:stage III sporulation protein AA [Bacillota bacterium]
MKIKEILMNYFGKRLRDVFERINEDIFEDTNEIRLRRGRTVIFRGKYGEMCFDEKGKRTSCDDAIRITGEDIKQMIELMSDYSPYIFKEEIKNGFFTLKGGFRVGVAGRVVYENGNIAAIKYISGLNIRIAREVKGCCEKIYEKIKGENILIISPPNCGKTTLLRDIIRKMSSSGINVGVVDERGEIAGSYMGDEQNDLGERTDVLDRCPKVMGMRMLLRSMAPDYIAVDEIGGAEDISSIEEIVNCGVGMICSIHAADINELTGKRNIRRMIEDKIFGRYIVLSARGGKGTIEGIYDEKLKEVRI